MKNAFRIVILTAFFAPAAVGWAQLNNPSFEDGLNGWQVYEGTIGTDVDAFVAGAAGPLGVNPDAPDGSRYAGNMHNASFEDSEPVIWQKYMVRNHLPGSITNYSVELDVACWANDVSGDPNSQVHISIAWQNDGLWNEAEDDPSDPERICNVGFVSHKFTGNNNSVTPFRHVKITGTLPDDPQEIIVRIRFIHNTSTEGQLNMTLVDNVIFSAESGSPPAPPATNLLANGDFETEPFNLTYDPQTQSPANFMPSSWIWGGDGVGDDGPGQGFTNGMTSPTNPLGVSTTNGAHFYGVAKPNTVGTQPKITIYQVVPVSGYRPCATGLRYKLHYLSNNSTDPVPADYPDRSTTRIILRWNPDGGASVSKDTVSPWIRIPSSNTRFTGNAQSDMTAVDTSGEVETFGNDGLPLAVAAVLFEVRFDTWRLSPEDSLGTIYRALGDDFRLEIEAVIPPGAIIADSSPLPDADCTTPYQHQLQGCGQEPLSWTVIGGSLPPGLEMSSSGLISGQASSAGTYTFTVQLEDGTGSKATREFSITSSGLCCGSIPADFDRDGDVDQADFSFLQICLTGDTGGIIMPPEGPNCSCADLDLNGLGVGQSDLLVFGACASGPAIAAIEGCDQQ